MCTKNKSNLSTVQRETQRQKLCTNLSPDICTRYRLTLYRVLKVYILYKHGWKCDWSMAGIVLSEDLFIYFFYQQKSEVITRIKEGTCYCLVFVQSCERIQRYEILINRNTDFIWTIFLYTVLNVVVMNMMECYY